MFIVDAHLDLSMNAVLWNRDLTDSISEIRRLEAGMTDFPDRERGTVSLPEMRKGKIGLCVATQIGRYVKKTNSLPGFHSPEIAWAITQAELAWYKAMEEKGEMVMIRDSAELDQHLDIWMNDPPADAPIGYVLSLEGADSIRTPKHLEQAYEQGLRAVGPAHYGPGTYAFGTASTGSIGELGRELLTEMERLNMILDATHLCDESFWEAMDHFGGTVWASHNNCRAIIPGDRQFSDEQIKALIDRGAVIGAAFDAWMLYPNWERGVTTPESSGVVIDNVLDHIDHVCELAGNANHAAIGTDLDGAFGTEQSPGDLETIADLQKIPAKLSSRGYSDEDINKIMHGNWIRRLHEAWD